MRKFIVLLLSVIVLFVSCSTTNVIYDIHQPLLEEYLSSPVETASVYAKGQKELSKPERIRIGWKDEGKDEYIFLLSTSEDFRSAREYRTKTNYVELENLFTGKTYYWRVEGTSSSGSFTVAGDSPRVIDIDGVTNVRDIGGWREDIKQGMLYRSARLSENKTGESLITDEGRKTVVGELGIKTEVDLRDSKNNEYGSITASAAGEEVRYIHYPMKSGGSYLILNIPVLPGLFEILGNEENYPLLFHCAIGTDRTGVVAFLVNGLLGVSEEDLYRDYLISNFALVKVIRTPGDIREYIEYMDRYPGETLSERIESFLLESGVEKSDIDSLRRIMTES